MTQTLNIQHLPPEAIDSLIPHLPDYVVALLQKAAELECSLEAAIEMAICLRHATRTQAISMKRLIPLLIVSLSLNSDRPFWDESAGGDGSAIAL